MRGGWRRKVAAALLGSVALGLVGTADLDALGTGVWRTDGVDGRMNTYAGQVSDAHIWDLQVVGHTIYAAGKFTTVVVASDNWARVSQPFLAAFDTRTGDWVSGWRPEVDRPVYALDLLESGAIVAGGEFTRVNGVPRRGIVALDPVTGATDPAFDAEVRRSGVVRQAVIRDFDRRGNKLYAVGNFSQASGGAVNGLPVFHAVRFNATTGQPDAAWRPHLAGASAYAVAVSTDGLRVHLGGEFSSVNGGRGTSQLATVSARTAELTPRWDHGSHAPFFPVWPVGGVVFDLDVWGDNLFLAGAEHFWEMRSSVTGASLRYQHITNDGQTVEVFGDRVYIGCHCFNRDPAHQMWEVNARTGQPYPGSTGELQSGDGTWAVARAEDGCIWLGGDFRSTSRLIGQGYGLFWVGRLARLCPPSGPEGAPVPRPLPSPINPPWWDG